ncbi:MAG: trehalose-phosphatase [Pseudomonadota bacterium]|jgi:trehalose 6-phosphate phosphatase
MADRQNQDDGAQVLDTGGVLALADRLAARKPALFLDFDGTLCDIALRPDHARMDPAMRDLVRSLARLCPVGILSGRDLEDVKEKVGVPGLIYGGSHGLDLEAPGGRHQLGDDHVPALRRIDHALTTRLAVVHGALIERKRYAIAVHIREVAPPFRDDVAAVVAEVVGAEPGLRQAAGKELFEIRPDIEWDKGRALLHLLRAEGLERYHAVYIGDDVTDEDAFAVLRGPGRHGTGIRVAGQGGGTLATEVIPDIAAVGALLSRLHSRLSSG